MTDPKVSTLVEGQSWTVMAPDGKTYVLELNEAGDKIQVSRNTIAGLQKEE